MHMADALISPVVGGAMLVAAGGTAAYSIKKIQNNMDEKKIPLMGVMGAFVFAAQMINFSIPGTGSSGHIGGGLLLAALLGPAEGFLTLASVLLMQALFFGDGGLLAYGCNLFNLGFYTCFLAYPLIYKKITRTGFSQKKILLASVLTSVIGLQLGAFSVVMETFLSGKTELPLGTFLIMMQPIHLAIGIVEGMITASILTFIWKTSPETLESKTSTDKINKPASKKIVAALLAAAIVTAGVLSLFASSNPDGLEWSMEKTSGSSELETKGGLYEKISEIQQSLSVFPDYSFKNDSENPAGTSFSGIIGGAATLAAVTLIGLIINIFVKKKNKLT